jgi:hypothetical protein
MITGVRLTQLANGEPLLGTAWYYKNLSGAEAAQQKLQDLFDIVQDIGFEFIIDSIKPILNVNGELTLENQGAYGDIWSFNERANAYESLLTRTGLNIVVEIEFPTIITSENWQTYADYFIQLVEEYNWIQNWQIMVNPEMKDQLGNYKCSPINYVRFMKYVYPIIKMRFTGVKIGGPGIFTALIDYTNRTSTPTDWLSVAIGDVYQSGTAEYTEIGNKGFLPYIDFFSIQAIQNLDNRLSYESLPQIIDNLNMNLKLKTNKDFQILSINQGHAALKDNENSINEQGYYDIREILNCIKKGIIPFKNQLVDEFININSPEYANDKYHMGLMEYFLGDESYKLSYKEFKFLLNALKDFNKVIDTNQVVDNKTNVDLVSLINTTGDKSVTIIWPKHFENTLVTLQPHYARQYYLPNGNRNSIVNPTQVQFSTETDGIHFVIVYQTINKTTINMQELEDAVDWKLEHTEKTLKQLISLLPNTYNKEVTDTNYYKMLRAIALELADAKIEVDKLNDDLYLDTVRGPAIYNNFGTLINLNKKADWDYEKYRRLVKGVTKSLINGPTTESVVDAVKLFTNFDVNIYELYKNYIHIDQGVLGNVKPQYAFIVEIEKPIEAPAEQGSLYEDTNYVISIVKPAHTIHLVLITLTGKENYRQQYLKKYGIDFSNSDKTEMDSDLNNTENTFGWKCVNYNGQFKTADVGQDEIFTNNSLTNGGLFIGPRYVLYDDSTLHFEQTAQDRYHDIIEVLHYQELKFAGNKELYTDTIDEDHLDYWQNFNELRFGFDMSTTFMHNRTFLNGFKLSPTSKLRDEMWSELEWFLKEKFTIKSETLDYELEMLPQDFIDMDCIDEDIDYNVDIQEIIPDFFENLNVSINQLKEEEYDAQLIQENQEYTVENQEVYDDKIIDTIPDINVDMPLEQLREWKLTDSFYHIHKKYTKYITTMSQNEYYLPNGDLYTGGKNIESTAKVYINGLLEYSFNYEEIGHFFVPDKVTGIRFLPDVLYPGDIVTILYLWDQSLLVSNFKISDHEFSDEMFSEVLFTNEVVWEVTKCVNDELHIYTYYNEEMKTVNSLLDTVSKIIEYLPYDEYKVVSDVPEFEGSPYLDMINWNMTLDSNTSKFITLNKSVLNNSVFHAERQEVADNEAAIEEETFRPLNYEYTMELFQIIDGQKYIIQTS